MEKNTLQLELERARSQHEVIDLIDTNFHRNGFRFPPGPIEAAMSRYLRERSYDPDPRGSADARRAVGAYYARADSIVGPQQLILTASSSESYNLLFNNFTEPGDNILLPRPTYPLFEYLAGFNHLEARWYDLDPADGFRIDSASLEAAIDHRTRFIVLISPNNPTGRAADSDEVDRVVEIAGRRKVMLICDEVFSEFLYDGTPLVRPMDRAGRDESAPLVFTLNGISKMFALPDLKLSWIAVTGPVTAVEAAVDRLEVANDMFLNCNSFSQYLLPHLFESGADFVRGMVERLDASRRALLAGLSSLPQLRVTPPNGGIHATIGIEGLPAGWDDERVAVELLRREQVYVHPGYLYGIEDSTFIVVSFLHEPDSFARGLTRLCSSIGTICGAAS
ncbi:pyridoxal phosphate-dependent aminotransferase [Salinispira pacifica]